MTLDGNIQLTGNIITVGSAKTLHGQSYLIDANGYRVKVGTKGASVVAESLKLTNTDIYGVFWSDLADVTVTYKDVDHEGKQMLYLPYGKLIIEGTVTSTAQTQNVYAGRELEVASGGVANFTSVNAVYSAIHAMSSGNKVVVDATGELNISAQSTGILGDVGAILTNDGTINATSETDAAIHLEAGSTIDLNDGSETHVVANGATKEPLEAANGIINVRSGATLEVEAHSTHGAVITGDTLQFEDGASFSITNDNGPVFGSYIAKTTVEIASATGVQTWQRGADYEGEADTTYAGPFTASFDLFGYTDTVTQSAMASNNQQFFTAYETAATGKIVGGSFAESTPTTVALPTMNKIVADADEITGTGVDGATVTVVSDDVTLGTAEVTDGKWTLKITPLNPGVTVMAHQTQEGVDSGDIAAAVLPVKSGINGVTDQDVQLSGIGTAGATLHVLVNGDEIGTATVGDGNRWTYELTEILKPGDRVAITQTINGTTGDQNTTDVTHLDNQTVNTFKP